MTSSNKLDLAKVNEKLKKYGEQPLKALYGNGDCAICCGAKSSSSSGAPSEWSILVPCGHIFCTQCMHVLGVQGSSAIKCPLCAGMGKGYRLVGKHCIQPINQPSSNCSFTSKIANLLFSNKSSSKGSSSPNGYYHQVENHEPVLKKSIAPIENQSSSSSTTGISFTYDYDSLNRGIAKLSSKASDNKLAIDIVLLLDVSGSVSHYFRDFIEMTRGFVDMLSQNDRFSLVTFSGVASQPFSLQPVTAEAKPRIKDLIKQTSKWGGSTNLEVGAKFCRDIIKEGQILGRTMYFILVTDGKADSGKGGINELREILNMTNIVVKMCSFGSNIDAKILTDVLTDRQEDYYHLDTIGDFNTLVKSIGIDRRTVVADNIKLYEGDHILNKLPQLQTGEEIQFPFRSNYEKIYITYTDEKGKLQNLFAEKDPSLNNLIEAVHAKDQITDKLTTLLAEVQGLRGRYSCTSEENRDTKISTEIAQYKFRLEQLSKSIEESFLGPYKLEILELVSNVNEVLIDATNYGKNSNENYSSSNTAFSCAFKLKSCKSTI